MAPDAEMGALDLQHDGAALASSVTVKSPPEKLMAFLVTVSGTTCGAQNCGDTTATGTGAGASAEVSLSIKIDRLNLQNSSASARLPGSELAP